MIGRVTYNNNERFVIADLVARQMVRSTEAESAGLVMWLSTPATSADLVLIGLGLEQRWGAHQKRAHSRSPCRLPDLKSYAGQWVVVSGDQVAEHGTNLADVVKRARQRGESKPYVIFVEQLEEGTARISL